MKSIFLSASVPVPGRGSYADTADPFLIQTAVRELVIATIRTYRLVWGGHPAITPMIWAICRDLGAEYAKAVVLYQSAYFENRFPEENERFRNVIVVEAVSGDREESLGKMRREMLSRKDLWAGVFIGGMEGIHVEYSLFRHFHPDRSAIIVASPGGAARELAIETKLSADEMEDVDFAGLFRRTLGV